MEDRIIVAAELCSSEIKAMVAKKGLGENTVELIAVEPNANVNNLSGGTILGASDMVFSMQEKLSLLNNRIEKGALIHSLYIALGGYSVNSVRVTTIKDFSTPTRLTEQDMLNFKKDAERRFPYDNKYIIKTIAQVFIVDEDLEIDPIGLRCSHIEAEYLIVYCDQVIKDNIDKSLEHLSKYTLKGLSLSLECSAHSLLTETQRQDGVVLIDFGSTTTSVIVYKDNIIRHVAVIPFGGDHITKDIVSETGVSMQKAKELKVKYGSAIVNEELRTKVLTIKGVDNNHTIPYMLMMDVILARLEEIVEMCKMEIANSGISSELYSGVVVTGMSSNLKDMNSYLQREIGLSVQRASIHVTCTNKELLQDDCITGFSALLGLVLTSEGNCVNMEEEAEEPVVKVEKKTKSKKGGFLGTLTSLFDEDDENL